MTGLYTRTHSGGINMARVKKGNNPLYKIGKLNMNLV